MKAYRADLYAIIDEFFNGERFAPVPLDRASSKSLSAASGMAVGGKAFVAPPDPKFSWKTDSKEPIVDTLAKTADKHSI